MTICTQGRMRCLCDIVDGEVVLSPVGEVVAQEWLEIPLPFPRVVLDEWVVMPDHFHGILIFQQGNAYSLGTVIGRFKSEATKRVRGNLRRPGFGWQERFHDTILKTPADLERVRAYIRDNPERWSPDPA